MTLTRFVRIQLVVFALLAVASLVFALGSYVNLPRQLGIGTYSVTVSLPQSAGLYEKAIVTYRGVDIGEIEEISLTETGVDATLSLDADVPVPAAVVAEQHSVSAIGEQYIDLVPRTADGPMLREGSHIPADRTTHPVPTGELLASVNTLVATLPRDSLHTVVDEAYQAFRDSDQDLSTLLNSSDDLLTSAQKNIGPTKKLIKDLEPLLDTGTKVDPDFRSSMRDLGSFSEQLVLSDDQIRQALERGPGFAHSVSGLLTELRPTVPMLLANLQTVGQVLRVNLPGLRHVLTVYPALSASLSGTQVEYQQPGVKPEDPQGPLDFKIPTLNLPPPCTKGFEGITRRDPSELAPAEPPKNAYCKVPHDDPRSVRGAHNMPCATNPRVRAAEVSQCPLGLPSTWPGMLARPSSGSSGSPGSPNSTGSDASRSTPYDPHTGTFFAPDGRAFVLADLAGSATSRKEERTWQELMLSVVSK